MARVTRDQAIELGEEKAYAIARLVATTPEADTVATMLATGVQVGKKKRAAQSMSRRDLEAVKRTIAARVKKVDPAERDAKREARAAEARLRARRVSAKVDVVKTRCHWWAVIRIPVETLSSVVGER